MSEDEFEFKAKHLFYICIAVAVVVLLMFWKSNNNEQTKKIDLLISYQNGFNQCNSLCEEDNKTGYIHAFDELRHKCFCFGNNTMEVQDV